ncbi:MAG: Mth938-like domain-containing protein [Caldimonas sp.]|uniref:Mth938-like domain-containing protein n=1 Tax=Caldimonas sp. TaxID=2838790 RepID=UPI00391D5CD8
MKLQPDRADSSLNIITAHTARGIAVNAVVHASSLLVPWRGPVQAWSCQAVADLTVEDFARAAELAPEVVLLGTGSRLQFARPQLLQPLMARRIGVETMDTAAACRTYNILAGEGRSVVALLMLSPLSATTE